jgi:hypothetical protein
MLDSSGKASNTASAVAKRTRDVETALHVVIGTSSVRSTLFEG